MSSKLLPFEQENAEVLYKILMDPTTPDTTRMQIVTKLIEDEKTLSFFEKMYEAKLSYGACPNCQHEQHWSIPEDELNQMGWVSAHRDSRVKAHTTAEDCEVYQEACIKKKVSM